MKVSQIIEQYLRKYQNMISDITDENEAINEDGYELSFAYDQSKRYKKFGEKLFEISMVIFLVSIFFIVFLCMPFGLLSLYGVKFFSCITGIFSIFNILNGYIFAKLYGKKCLRIEKEYDKLNRIFLENEVLQKEIVKKISNLNEVKQYFTENPYNGILNNLYLTTEEINFCLDNDMSIICLLYLKHMNLITNNQILQCRFDIKGIHEIKKIFIDVKTILSNDPFAFERFKNKKEDSDSSIKSLSDVSLEKSIRIKNNQVKRRHFNGYPSEQHDDEQSIISRRR